MLLIAILITISVLIFYIFRYFAFYKGVFAVSAIIFNDKHEILLIEEDGKKKQPGAHYKTNKFAFRKELDTPYNYVINAIEKETGIKIIDLEPINFNNIRKEDSLKNITTNEIGSYGNNILSLEPCCILHEISNSKKTSGEKSHIDLFYAFKYNSKTPNEKNKFVSLEELKATENVHKDLCFLGESIIQQYKKMKYPQLNIRLCTFSDNQSKKIYWRLTKKCNANCSYCISKSPNSHNIELTKDDIQKNIKLITDNKYEKVILTGGEPLLLMDDVIDIVKGISEQAYYCEEISICTNALSIIDTEKFTTLCSYGKLKKFVVSVDAYNNEQYCNLKNTSNNNNNLERINRFIKTVKESGKEVTINVIASYQLLSKTNEYVNYWRQNNYSDISISYPVFSKTNFRNKLIQVYKQIIEGQYGDMSFCKSLELILPDCERKGCKSPNIHSININKFYGSCIDNISKRDSNKQHKHQDKSKN